MDTIPRLLGLNILLHTSKRVKMNLVFDLETEREHKDGQHVFRTSLESWKWLNDELRHKQLLIELAKELREDYVASGYNTDRLDRIIGDNQ